MTSDLHGLLLHFEDDIDSFESDHLDGNVVECITTAFDTSRFPDSWWGPAWPDRSGDGTQLEQKIQSIENVFGGTERTLIMSYNIGHPVDEGQIHDYAFGANGNLDSNWRSMAQDLVAMEMEDTILRLNGEFNLRWGNYPTEDGTSDGVAAPDDYAAAFARCVDVMLSVDGANFEFVYSPGGHRAWTDDPEDLSHECWPMDSPQWVDGRPTPLVGRSFYDPHQGHSSPSEWDAMTDAEKEAEVDDVWQNGHLPELQLMVDFANNRGARLGIVEWGVATEGYPGGFGDNPWFIEKMFQFYDAHDFRAQAYWNQTSAAGGSHRLYPTTEMPRSRDQFIVEMQARVGGAPSVGGYARPPEGTTDWHLPLNDNFANIEADISNLSSFLNAGVSVSLNQPPQRATDWHIPLNENFHEIETAVSSLADAAGVTGVGGYNKPAEGTTDWHIPLNENFQMIESDLQTIADAG